MQEGVRKRPQESHKKEGDAHSLAFLQDACAS